MKGIILSGGLGTRLYPVTLAITKQLLPVYDKPMIHYPLSTLMLAGIRDILVITTSSDIDRYKMALGDGSDWGISISYATQDRPDGIAQAFIIGEEFIGGEPCALILGDNIFYGHGLSELLLSAASLHEGAMTFAYRVRDPERYGVVEFDENFKALSIEEKPKSPRSAWALTGLYFYDGDACSIARTLKPSSRGELEITDVNNIYLEKQSLSVECLGRGFSWFDTGTHDALIDAALFVQVTFHRQGLRICCVEEIAYRMGFIDRVQLQTLSNRYKSSPYGIYLVEVANEKGALARL